MGLQDNAWFQCLPISIPGKKTNLKILSENYPAVRGRHRPTEHPAVFLGKPFIPDDALRDLFRNRAETYLHGDLLVNTFPALFYPLFLAIVTGCYQVPEPCAPAGPPGSPMQTKAGRRLCRHHLPGAGCPPLVQGTGVTSAAAIRPPARPQPSPRGGGGQKSLLTRGKRQHFLERPFWEGGK